MNGHSRDRDGVERRQSVAGREREQIPGAILSSRALQPSTTSRSTSPARGAVPSHLYGRLPPYCLLEDGTPDYIRLTLTSRVYDLIQPTPMTEAVHLSGRLGCNVLLKREDLQPVFSFKIRGAFNLMAHLTEEERWKGVVACSAGNHAQGVAMAGQKLGIACTIVMPLNTPSIKWSNVERLGAKVVLHGADFDEAKRECARLAQVHGLTNIPPFDDPYVIAGQGTSAIEVLRQADPSKLDAVFCCVGGGGLLAGVAAYIKKIAPPNVNVIGVETLDGDAMTRSLKQGKRVVLNEVGLFSEGTAVRVVGEEPFRLCSELVDEMILVSNDEACAAIKDIFEDTRSIVEPAGALAVAGMKKYVEKNNLTGSGKMFVAFASGANINFDRLRFVAERAELGEKREALLSVAIPERPGSFRALHEQIAPRAVTLFSYRYDSAQGAHVMCSFLLSAGSSPNAPKADANGDTRKTLQEARQAELQGIVADLQNEGMEATDLSGDELAKSHAIYLVGGRVNVENERLFRFEFPERPGALKKFLLGLQSDWNVSLFHYRNTGGDIGKVLVGIQVPPADYSEFDQYLAELGFSFVEETQNATYKKFLVDQSGQ